MNGFNVCYVTGWDGRRGEYVLECIDDDIANLADAIDDANEYYSSDGSHYVVIKRDDQNLYGNDVVYDTKYAEDK